MMTLIATIVAITLVFATLLQDIDKWALEHMEDTLTLEHQGDNLQPSAKRPRNGATFETSDPFSDLRDSAVDKMEVCKVSPPRQTNFTTGG